MSDQTDDGADAYHFITYERIGPVLDGMAAVTTGFVYCNQGTGPRSLSRVLLHGIP